MAEMRQFLLSQASRRIHAAVTLADALAVLADEAVGIVGAHQGFASLISETGTEWTLAAISLSDKYAAWWQEERLQAGSPIYAASCPDRRPIRLTQAELEHSDTWRRYAAGQDARPPLRGWLCAPILGPQHRTLGIVQLSDKYDGEFTEQDEADLVELAGATASAVQRLRVDTGRRDGDSLFRAAFEHADVGMSMADSEGRFMRANAAFCRLTGYTQDELRALTVPGITHPDDRAADAARHEALFRGRLSSFLIEKRYVRKDGGIVWVRNSVSAVAAGPGGNRATIGLSEDITERRTAEETLTRRTAELESALARIRRIVASSPDIIANVDNEGRFIEISPRCREIWGYEPEELIGRPYIDLVHPDDREVTTAEAKRLMTGKPNPAFVNRYQRKDGSIVYMQWSAIWSEEDGCYFAVARDITTRIETEDRLRQSQRLEAIGQLTGGIAHDFNNLLMVILGTAEIMMERAGQDRELHSLAETVRVAAERGGELTNRLLAFGRRQSLQPRPIDVSVLMGGMIAMLQRTLGERIHIELAPGGTPAMAMVDPAQLETAILNLCINARDAMPDGGRLIISVGPRSVAAGGRDELAAGDYIKLAISDTGNGMSEAVRLRAFEPFFTTKEVGKGTGLGLSMVYGFAKQSGGSVTIESKIGVGTRVTLLLPVAREVTAVAAPEPEPAKAPTPRERILLCEDDAMVRLRVEEMLSGLGYRVTAVGDAEAALDALKNGEKFDLLFTDIVMPGTMNGTQLAREARRQHPHLHLLFTSGHAEQALAGIEDFERGAVLLKKPYRRSELAARVREALGNGG